MRAPKLSKKTTAIIAGSALVLGTGGVAYAYWSTTGTGSGTATTTAGVAGQLTFAQTAITPMYPGDAEQVLTVAVTNTANESAYVSGVKAFITTDQPGCTGADFLLGGTSGHSDLATAKPMTWSAVDLGADSSANATSTVQFNNTAANQDDCKSADVTINYVAN